MNLILLVYSMGWAVATAAVGSPQAAAAAGWRLAPEVQIEATGSRTPLVSDLGTTIGTVGGAPASEVEAREVLRRAFAFQQYEQVLALCDQIDARFPRNRFARFYRSAAQGRLNDLRRAREGQSLFPRMVPQPPKTVTPVKVSRATTLTTGGLIVGPSGIPGLQRSEFPKIEFAPSEQPWRLYLGIGGGALACLLALTLLLRTRKTADRRPQTEGPTAEGEEQRLKTDLQSPKSPISNLQSPAIAAESSTLDFSTFDSTTSERHRKRKPPVGPADKPRRRPLPQEVEEDFEGEPILEEGAFEPLPVDVQRAPADAESRTPRLEPTVTFHEGLFDPAQSDVAAEADERTEVPAVESREIPIPGLASASHAMPEASQARSSARSARERDGAPREEETSGDDLVMALLSEIEERTAKPAPQREEAPLEASEFIRLDSVMTPDADRGEVIRFETPEAVEPQAAHPSDVEPSAPAAPAAALTSTDTHDLLAYDARDEHEIESGKATMDEAPGFVERPEARPAARGKTPAAGTRGETEAQQAAKEPKAAEPEMAKPELRHPVFDELEIESIQEEIEPEESSGVGTGVGAEVDMQDDTRTSWSDGEALDKTAGLSSTEQQAILHSTFDLPAVAEDAQEFHSDQTATIDLEIPTAPPPRQQAEAPVEAEAGEATPADVSPASSLQSPAFAPVEEPPVVEETLGASTAVSDTVRRSPAEAEAEAGAERTAASAPPAIESQAMDAGEEPAPIEVSGVETPVERGDETPVEEGEATDPAGGMAQNLFDRELRLGRTATRDGNWDAAVHHLSIAAALKPEMREVKEELREARRQRKRE